MTARNEAEYGNESAWSFVRLSLVGKQLDPQEVTKVLGIQPDVSAKLGEPVGPDSPRKCKQGSWTLESDRLDWQIETQMKDILERLGPVRDRLAALIRDDATIEQAYLTLAFELPRGQRAPGYYFASDVMHGFTSLGLDLHLTIYLPEDSEVTGDSEEGESRTI